MKKIGFGFIAFFIVSCAVPNEIKLNDLKVDLSCLSPKEQMYIIMDFDRCPVFGNTPTPNSHYWELLRVGDLKSGDKISTNSDIENIKNCAVVSESMFGYLVKNDVALFVDSIILRTDSVSRNRLLIYGKTVRMGQEIKWIFDIKESPDADVVARVKANFNTCTR